MIQKNSFYGVLAGLVAALGWGSIGLWIKEIPLSAFEIATYRFLGAGLFLTLATLHAYKKNTNTFSKRAILGSAICGMTLALQFVSTIIAYQRLLVGEATALTNLHIFVIGIASFLVVKSSRKLLLVFAVNGLLFFLALYLLFVRGSAFSFDYLGMLMGICSSILFGLYTIMVEKFFPENPERYIGFIFAFGSIPLLIYLFITTDVHLLNLQQSGWINLLVLIFFSTIIAHSAYLLAVKWSNSMTAGILSYSAIVVAFFIDIFLGKSISLQQWLGAIMLVLILANLSYIKSTKEIHAGL